MLIIDRKYNQRLKSDLMAFYIKQTWQTCNDKYRQSPLIDNLTDSYKL